MKDLKIFLTQHPHVKEVYLNEQYGWVLSPNHAHPIKATREEILDSDEEEDTTDDELKSANYEAVIKNLQEENTYYKNQIGTLPEGVHGDDMKPRAETWLQERANWETEVERLNIHVKELTEENTGLKKENEKLKKKISS